MKNSTEEPRESIIRGRERLGLSRPALARIAGVAAGTISNIESGRTQPTRGVLEKLRAALAADGEEGTPAPQPPAAAQEDGVPDVIEVTPAGKFFQVSIRDLPEMKAVGLSLAEAVGNLVLANQRWFQVELETGTGTSRR